MGNSLIGPSFVYLRQPQRLYLNLQPLNHVTIQPKSRLAVHFISENRALRLSPANGSQCTSNTSFVTIPRSVNLERLRWHHRHHWSAKAAPPAPAVATWRSCIHPAIVFPSTALWNRLIRRILCRARHGLISHQPRHPPPQRIIVGNLPVLASSFEAMMSISAAGMLAMLHGRISFVRHCSRTISFARSWMIVLPSPW